MADVRIIQKKAASLTYIDDWTNRLAKAYPGQTITISSAVGTTTAGTLSGVSGSGTSIVFHLATSALTPPIDITVTLTATLSNADVDPRDLIVGVV